MSMPDNPVTLIKDIRPGLRQLTSDFIVLEIYPSTKTKEGKDVATVKVADATGSINVVLYGDYVAALQPSDVLRMTCGYAVVNKGSMCLYMSRNGSLTKIGEFCFLFSEVPNMSDPNSEFLSEYAQQQQHQQNGRGASPPNLEIPTEPSGLHGQTGFPPHRQYQQQQNHPGGSFTAAVPQIDQTGRLPPISFDALPHSGTSPPPDQIPSAPRVIPAQGNHLPVSASSGPVDPRASRGGQNRYQPYPNQQQSHSTRTPLQPIGTGPGGMKPSQQSQMRSFSSARSGGGPPVIPSNPVVSFRSGPSQHSAAVRR